MKRLLLLLIGLWSLSACAGPPKIYPLADGSGEVGTTCDALFPVGEWQFLHAVEVQMPGGNQSVLMGVTDIYSPSSKVTSVIMTVEGLVLFEAEYDRNVTVLRGIAPFDATDFAQGLMDDIRFIFFRPPGRLLAAGALSSGAKICRYENPSDYMTDAIIEPNGSWTLRQYDQRHRLNRLVQAAPIERSKSPFPRQLELATHGQHRYRLKMTLIKATPLRSYQ